MTNDKSSALSRLLKYAKTHRPRVIWAAICSVTNKLFDIAPEILIGMAIDVVVSGEKSFVAGFGITDPWHQILVLGVLTLLIWGGESLFEYLLLINWRGLAQDVQHELRCDAYDHLQNLDISFFENKNTGSLTSILNDDINQLERFLDGGASQMIQTFTAVVGVGTVFFVISPSIATVAFLPIPVIIIGAFYFQKRAMPLYAGVREKVGLLNTRLNNNISGLVTIKSFTNEQKESAALKTDSLAYVNANLKAIAVSSAFIPVIRMAILSGFLATFIWGAWQVNQGDLAVGAYGVLVFLTQRLLWPLTGLAATVDLYERAMASTRRILDLLDQPISIATGDKIADSLKGEIQFKNLHFAYDSSSEILKGLNFEIPANKTTALVGSTGSGKSTLIKLLLRFYEPSKGEVLIDGEAIENWSLPFLRKQIGLVSQDVFLFHGTVRENLAYGNPEASEEELLSAASLAEAHDFIANLPEGFDTVIGERGQKLSGGQRQRLSIARAILKDPPILILDEATSAVDNETEAAIQRSLAKISKHRTVVVIAHRLSTIVDADQILVLENGKVAESGRHADLIDSGGLYDNLWKVQTGASGFAST
ncbi:MAG: ABC transporter ATP-binding protein [Bdellovibrionales bacterium]|nr:ABC transporter ATP-binding protein [Bdellovibrionales bacterium]